MNNTLREIAEPMAKKEVGWKETVENQVIIDQFAKKLLEDLKPMPAEFAQILRDNFWDLV